MRPDIVDGHAHQNAATESPHPDLDRDSDQLDPEEPHVTNLKIARPKVVVRPVDPQDPSGLHHAHCENCGWTEGPSVKTYLKERATRHRADHRNGAIPHTGPQGAPTPAAGTPAVEPQPAPHSRGPATVASSGDELETRRRRVAIATSALRRALTDALAMQASGGVEQVRLEAARTAVLRTSADVLAALGRPVRLPRGTTDMHGSLVSPRRPRAATAPDPGLVLTVSAREAANLRAALSDRFEAVAISAGPERTEDLACIRRLQTAIDASTHRPVAITRTNYLDLSLRDSTHGLGVN